MSSYIRSAQEEQLLKLELRLAQLERNEACQKDFLTFVRAVWPDFIAGRHHRIIAEKLERIANGELKRLIVNMPPRHTKSEFASYLFPAWFMGRYPNKKIIQSTHTTELAVGFGRKTKNLIETDEYREIFPDVKLAVDSKASGRWDTNSGGMYYAVGVGSNLAGRGGDLVIIDDPHSEQTAMTASGFDDAWDWYTGGPRQRLQPGGAIVLVQCMTGDTPVLMADGTERPLRDIRPGDEVATYDNDRLMTAKILNWQSSGVDSVYKILTKSGKVIRANRRHPFFVDDGGDRKWVRLQNLRPGMRLVSLRDAKDPLGPSPSPDSAELVRKESDTTEINRGRFVNRSAIMVNGPVWNAPRLTAHARCFLKAFADAATAGQEATRRTLSLLAHTALSISTESLWRITTQWLLSETTAVTSAAGSLPRKTLGPIGAENCALTTVTTRERSEASCAMTATLPSDTVRHLKGCEGRLTTSSFTTDEILRIEYDGEEEVFDVEVERTSNFIANGFVSHNTRWSEKDLTGQLLRSMAKDPLADQWEVVELPAIFDDGTPCWPEYWSLEDLTAVRASIPPSKWNAQYQQNPTGEENAIIPREWWRRWDRDTVPQLEYVIQSYDTAFSKRETSDFSAITTWGVFHPDESGSRPNLILLDSKKGRWDFPELKSLAYENYKFWEPDTVIIEAKASGLPLTHELRNMGIPVVNFTPSRGNDKVSRVHSVSPLFEAGMVWAPDEVWADEMIEEVAAFPNGEYDDLVDSMTQALMRYRQGNFVQLPTDDWEESEKSARVRVYY